MLCECCLTREVSVGVGYLKADGKYGGMFWMCGVCDPTLDELREKAKRFGIDLDDEDDSNATL